MWLSLHLIKCVIRSYLSEIWCNALQHRTEQKEGTVQVEIGRGRAFTCTSTRGRCQKALFRHCRLYLMVNAKQQTAFTSLRTYYFPLIQPVIEQDDILYDLIHRLRITYKRTQLLFHFWLSISLSFFMQSNRVEMTGQKVQQLRITSLSLSRWVPLVHICQALMHLALKGNGRWHSDWFDLCSAQNTPMG